MERVGQDHQPRVGVQVDEAGGHDESGRVDRPPGVGLLGVGAQQAEPIADDRDRARGAAGAPVPSTIVPPWIRMSTGVKAGLHAERPARGDVRPASEHDVPGRR